MIGDYCGGRQTEIDWRARGKGYNLITTALYWSVLCVLSTLASRPSQVTALDS